MNKNNPNLIRTELESIAAVQKRLGDPAATWHDVVIQNVDLRSVDGPLSKAPIAGCNFLGCDLGPDVVKAIAEFQCTQHNHPLCLIFPKMPGLPFNPYRATLYEAEELLGRFTNDDQACGEKVYETSVDWLSYQTFLDPRDSKPYTNDSVDTVLARRLHDTSISDALEDILAPIREKEAKRGVVAIMGGHDMLRLEKVKGASAGKLIGDEEWEAMTDDSSYTRVAFLAWRLTKVGYLLVSGGGPGAMEATHLGAYFAQRELSDLRKAIRTLAKCKDFKRGKSAEWLIPAMHVRRDFPLDPDQQISCQSVGIPTWLYGHEPPNPFATHIAKYFENSVREEGMLAIATHGVIFAEGNAGTVQEIFQDACQNYYATYGAAAPMFLLGRDYWDPPAMPVYVNDKAKKAFPLVRKLAEEKGFTHRLVVTDSLREIVKTINDYKPQ